MAEEGPKYRRRRPLVALLVRCQGLLQGLLRRPADACAPRGRPAAGGGPTTARARPTTDRGQCLAGFAMGLGLLLVPLMFGDGSGIWTRGGSKGVVYVPAGPILVKRNNPHQCPAAGSTNIGGKSGKRSGGGQRFAFPARNPVPVDGFPATPTLNGHFLADTNAALANAAATNGGNKMYDSVLFRGRASKLPNGPILSTGSSLLLEEVKEGGAGWEYRLLEVKAYLNYTAVHTDEGVASDVCVNVIPTGKVNSVSSGEEVFCTHEAFFGGDRRPIVERNGRGEAPWLRISFRPNGISLKPGYKLEVASVSKIYTSKWMNPLSKEETKARDAPRPEDQVEIPGIGRVETSLDLLALHFEALIVPVTPDEAHQKPPLRSARIPQRDRSAVPWLPTEEAVPLTAYRNSAPHPVTIRGLGIFRSMLVHYVAGDTLIRLLVDGEEVARYCPPPHRPTETSAPFDDLLELEVTVPPGSEVRVEHSLAAWVPDWHKPWRQRSLFRKKEDAYRPAPYDLALYVLYDHGEAGEGDGNSGEGALVPIEEDAVPGGNGALDRNGDGHPEFIDYDVAGTIWADLTGPDGSHDTQHGAVRSLITNRGKFDKPTTKWEWTRNSETNFLEAKVTDEAEGLCFRLRAKHAEMWVFEYCDESRVPYASLLKSKDVDHCFGDYDGDGRFDRLRLSPKEGSRDLELFFAKGDGARYVAERLVGTVRNSCSGEQPTMEALYLPSKGRHVAGYNSRCGMFHLLDLDGIDLKVAPPAGTCSRAKTPCRGSFAKEPPKAFVHFHIPKAAGSALEANVLSPLAAKREYRIFHHNDHAESVLYDIPEVNRTKVDILTGHQHYGLHAVMREGTGYISVLRDPVERVLSLYRYVRGSPTHPRHDKALGMSLGEFVTWASEETHNWVTLALCAPRDANVPGYDAAIVEECKSNATFAVELAKKHLRENFAVIGLQEHYAESVDLIKQCLDVKPHELLEEKATAVYGASKVTRGMVDAPSKDDLAAIRAANEMDLQVYYFARELFHEHCSGEIL